MAAIESTQSSMDIDIVGDAHSLVSLTTQEEQLAYSYDQLEPVLNNYQPAVLRSFGAKALQAQGRHLEGSVINLKLLET